MHIAECGVMVGEGIVGPDLTNIKVFDELDGISTPELLGGDKTARRDHRAWENLAAGLEASSFKDYRIVADNSIITNVS